MVLYESELRHEAVWPRIVGYGVDDHLVNYLPRSDEEVAAEILKSQVAGIFLSQRMTGREYQDLADSGSNYFVEAQDYGLIPKADARVEEREAGKGQGFVFLRNQIKKANVRQEPSKQSKVLCTVSNDGEISEYYPCLGYTQDKSYNSWYKVNINGKTGYISAKLLLWDSIRL